MFRPSAGSIIQEATHTSTFQLTLLAPWVNNPFSVMPTVMLNRSFYHGKAVGQGEEDSSSSNQADSDKDIEKSATIVKANARQSDAFELGLTFFIKKQMGITKRLRANEALLTLVEGPYPNNSSSQILACDRVLLIGGGIGITALVTFVACHHNVKLCWSIKSAAQCLLLEIDGVLQQVQDKQVCVGSRLDIQALLTAEYEAGWKKVGVVVAGPPNMCDETRALVTSEARRCRGIEYVLDVEAYSW